MVRYVYCYIGNVKNKFRETKILQDFHFNNSNDTLVNHDYAESKLRKYRVKKKAL